MPRPLLSFVLLLCSLCVASFAAPPNIVVILADDLGYGDVQCYNPGRGKIATPNIDRLAAEGMRFTDAHTSSGVCPPTRYALLTGRYHLAVALAGRHVGYLEKPLIAPDRLTLASLAKQHGYRTAMVGKWHLGWDWDITPEQRSLIAPPRGFDQYFGTDVPNWPPYAFIRDDRTVGIPTEFLPAAKLVKNQASIPGPALAGWKLEDVLPAITQAAGIFIEDAAKGGKPFFLYLPLTSPHTPIAVADEWRGKSGLNDYADFVMETDAMVGRVLDALVQQTDLMTTFAEVLGPKVPAGAGEDSVSLLPLLRGSVKPVREFAISHASSGLPALRKGSWKIIFGQKGGGFGQKATAPAAGQLYDLASDLGETKNLWSEKPELVTELTAAMERIVAAHPNDVPVNWRRFLAPSK